MMNDICGIDIFPSDYIDRALPYSNDYALSGLNFLTISV
jgi:hypothetical protein